MPFTSCISRINNTKIDDAQRSDVVMPKYNLIQYSDNYSKIFEVLWQYYRDETASMIMVKLLILMRIMLILISLK